MITKIKVYYSQWQKNYKVFEINIYPKIILAENVKDLNSVHKARFHGT